MHSHVVEFLSAVFARFNATFYLYLVGQLSLFPSLNRKYLTNKKYVYIDCFVNMLVIFFVDPLLAQRLVIRIRKHLTLEEKFQQTMTVQ